MIPEFDEHGYLPPGIHDASLDEISRRYGGSVSLKRGHLFKNLEHVCGFTRYFALDIFIDGSFISSKLAPGDVDLIIVLPQDFYTLRNYNNNAVRLVQIIQHQNDYHLHIFARRVGIEEAEIRGFIDYFQQEDRNKTRGVFSKGIIHLRT